MWQTYRRPMSLAEAVDLLHQYGNQARIVAGGTDVMAELRNGMNPTPTLIDISALRDLKYVHHEGNVLALGALTTHNDVIISSLCQHYAWPLVQACCWIAAPAIRTRATVAGNLITGSPANDAIAPLMALKADLVLLSHSGERIVPLRTFYTDVRRTLLQPGELLREIRIPTLLPDQRGLFLTLGLRRTHAYSVVSAAFVLSFEDNAISDARITLGSVAPTVVHARTAEHYLKGKRLDEQICVEAGRLAAGDARPIDDIRASRSYRLTTLATLVSQGLQRLAAAAEREGWLAHPVLLDTGSESQGDEQPAHFVSAIDTTINGVPYHLEDAQQKTLLNMLRDDVGLTGTKEGCAEGECGACTVWLNGQAVMACLVPAPQAHGASITTIEGLAQGTQLHPLQQAFIDHAAVQCGFCIPGMLMAGAKLLAEHPLPTSDQISVGLSGNICRCTGYRKILDAVQSVGGTSI